MSHTCPPECYEHVEGISRARDYKNVTKCIVFILNAKNEKADLQDIVSTHCQHFRERKQNGELVVLKFQELFNGTLGNLDNVLKNIS